MTATEIFSFASLLTSIVLTGVNLWWQGNQEEKRAKRTALERQVERDAARNERLHEHWLDTKIAIYRQFLNQTRIARAQIVRFGLNSPGPGPFPAQLIREAHEALIELTLVAPSNIAQVATEYFWATTWKSDRFRNDLAEARSEGDYERASLLVAAAAANDDVATREERRFLNLVRAELGLDALKPSTFDESAVTTVA